MKEVLKKNKRWNVNLWTGFSIALHQLLKHSLCDIFLQGEKSKGTRQRIFHFLSSSSQTSMPSRRPFWRIALLFNHLPLSDGCLGLIHILNMWINMWIRLIKTVLLPLSQIILISLERETLKALLYTTQHRILYISIELGLLWTHDVASGCQKVLCY